MNITKQQLVQAIREELKAAEKEFKPVHRSNLTKGLGTIFSKSTDGAIDAGDAAGKAAALAGKRSLSGIANLGKEAGRKHVHDEFMKVTGKPKRRRKSRGEPDPDEILKDLAGATHKKSKQITQGQLKQAIREELEAIEEEYKAVERSNLEQGLGQIFAPPLKGAVKKVAASGLGSAAKDVTSGLRTAGGIAGATLPKKKRNVRKGRRRNPTKILKDLKGATHNESKEWTSYEGDQQLFENWRRFVGE